ncbi:ABC transporter permease subunit [Micromonospora sp. LOL_015]|uniref:ABC transporter permease subunit n=2 Tax=unclassified Micromonospora TaxID=2617518 RepID=UPI003A8BF64F
MRRPPEPAQGAGLRPRAGRGSRSEVFAGLANYRAALADPTLLTGALRVLGHGALLMPVMLGLALLFALLLDRPRRGLQRFSWVAIFLPYAVPAVIASLLWGFLYLPVTSPLNDMLDWLGGPQPDLLDTGTVFQAVVNIALRGGGGFNMIVLFTALRAISPELYESARIDGCSELQIAWRIKILLLTPALVMTYRGGQFWRWVANTALLAGVLVPGVILAVPQYLLLAKVGPADTYWSILLPSIISPSGIYLARIYAAAVPDTVIEAAPTDGAGEFRIFRQVAVPMMVPGLITVSSFSSWRSGTISCCRSSCWPTTTSFPLPLACTPC